MLDVHIMQILRRCNLLLIHSKVLIDIQGVSSEDLKEMSGIHSRYKTELAIFVLHIILYIFWLAVFYSLLRPDFSKNQKLDREP